MCPQNNVSVLLVCIFDALKQCKYSLFVILYGLVEDLSDCLQEFSVGLDRVVNV
jgi:hypothetical protein